MHEFKYLHVCFRAAGFCKSCYNYLFWKVEQVCETSSEASSLESHSQSPVKRCISTSMDSIVAQKVSGPQITFQSGSALQLSLPTLSAIGLRL